MTASVSLADVPVVDNHCHGFRPAELLQLDPASWAQRLTMMGMCHMTSASSDGELDLQVANLCSSTVFALTSERWLSELLGVNADEDLSATRHESFSRSPREHIARLLCDQHIVALLADEGYPQPAVARGEFEDAVGIKVFRVARIEPWIVALRSEHASFESFEAAFGAQLEKAAADPLCVAYKSIIAYRSGLDVTCPRQDEAREAYRRWREGGWCEDRGDAKVVRDYLMHVTLHAARRFERPVHIHVGGGDPDVRLNYARPQDLFSLLSEYRAQPIVLIHSGYPWLAEAAYLASILPYVYLDLSEFMPWASVGIDRELETLIGVVPTSKLLYGSDEASEPEVLWISAKMARLALERVLSLAVDRDHLTTAEATRIGRGILSENTVALHGVSV